MGVGPVVTGNHIAIFPAMHDKNWKKKRNIADFVLSFLSNLDIEPNIIDVEVKGHTPHDGDLVISALDVVGDHADGACCLP